MIDTKFKKEFDKVFSEYYSELLTLKPEPGLKDVNSFRQKGLWAFKILKPQLHIIFGNAKLPETTCIVNMGTWFNCSGRKNGFCDICQKCYDKQIEVRFKERTRDRLEQEIYWRSCDAKTFAFELIRKIVLNNQNNSFIRLKTKKIRWNEVGELRNQDDLIKVRDVSNIVFNILGIESYIYTHNKELDFTIDRPHLTINGSNFMVDNEYRVVDDIEKEFNNLSDISNKRECICDCTQCSYCSEKGGFILIEELR